jgi:hypothetical protein
MERLHPTFQLAVMWLRMPLLKPSHARVQLILQLRTSVRVETRTEGNLAKTNTVANQLRFLGQRYRLHIDVRVTGTDTKTYCKRPAKVLESQEKEKNGKQAGGCLKDAATSPTLRMYALWMACLDGEAKPSPSN